TGLLPETWVISGRTLLKAAPGERAQGQRHDRVEHPPQKCSRHQGVVRGTAELEQHGYDYGVDHSEATSGDREYSPGPEGDGEGGERIRSGELSVGHSDESQRSQEDQEGQKEVRGHAERSQLPSLAQEHQGSIPQSPGLL